jgi:hypothetical protein
MIYADKPSVSLVSVAHDGKHVLVPFAMEDSGRLGNHAHAFLLDLALVVVRVVRYNRPVRLDSAGGTFKGEEVVQASWV